MRELYKIGQKTTPMTTMTGGLLKYAGIGKHLSVYNATPPLWLNVGGKMRRVIAGRVEHPKDWAHSRVMFFEECADSVYGLIPEAPIFYGEDPAIAMVNGEIILMTVRVSSMKKSMYDIETELRRAKDVLGLWECFSRIPGKDNRITPVDNGERIAVMTRPQGGEAGAGKMAYIELNIIEELTPEKLQEAKIIEIPKSDDTWVGPNQLFNLHLKNQIGILAHGAFETEKSATVSKTYFSFFMWLDRKSLKIVDIEPLAIRANFPKSRAKTPALKNVVFGMGLVIPVPEVGYAELYGGLGDIAQGFVRITNPKILKLYEDEE